MRFLGIDTSSPRASVAITEGGDLIAENLHLPETTNSLDIVHSRNNHAENLLSLIDGTLRKAGFSLSDVSGFAVAIGPGSFTGLRIGVSTVKGLSFGCGIPVIGVSTLHACAARLNDFNGPICAILDARKKEVYSALFRRGGGLLKRITKDAVIPFEKLVDLLCSLGSDEPILLAGDGARNYGELLGRTLGNRIFLRENDNSRTVAAAVALLGEALFVRGEAGSLASLTPRYLRQPEAEARAPKLA
jgi:tRNA threonylcarbamoyladenosine biosynthesis protein TsaB